MDSALTGLEFRPEVARAFNRLNNEEAGRVYFNYRPTASLNYSPPDVYTVITVADIEEAYADNRLIWARATYEFTIYAPTPQARHETVNRWIGIFDELNITYSNGEEGVTDEGALYFKEILLP